MFLPLGGEKRSFLYCLEKAEQFAARVGKHDDVHAEDDGEDVFHNIGHLGFLCADENREHDAGEEHDAADDQRDDDGKDNARHIAFTRFSNFKLTCSALSAGRGSR